MKTTGQDNSEMRRSAIDNSQHIMKTQKALIKLQQSAESYSPLPLC